jgi:hypothetical protein
LAKQAQRSPDPLIIHRPIMRGSASLPLIGERAGTTGTLARYEAPGAAGRVTR